MELKRTVICKVSDRITKKKLSFMDKITARITHCVNLFIELIQREYKNVKTGTNRISKSKLDRYNLDINLNSAYVQQCRDKAIWMYNSYLSHLNKWKRSFRRLCDRYKCFFKKNHLKLREILQKKRDDMGLNKKDKALLRYFVEFKSKIKRFYIKGRPKVPQQSKKYTAKKIPVIMDQRTCSFIKLEDKVLTKYWLSLSTLKKYHKVHIPLFFSDYQMNRLEGEKITSVQLVKRNNHYYAHLSYSIEVDIHNNPQRIKAVDLGINKPAVTVLLPVKSKLTKEDIKVYQIKHLKEKLHKLNLKMQEYQRNGLYRKLKSVRNKRNQIKLRIDHLISKQIAEDSKDEDVILVVGKVTGIRNIAIRGNYKGRAYRRKLNRWSFRRLSEFIRYKCNAYKIPVEQVNEAYTSRRCHKCGSLDTQRPSQGLFICNFGKTEYNADINGAMNIGLDYYINNIDPDYMFGLWGAQNTS